MWNNVNILSFQTNHIVFESLSLSADTLSHTPFTMLGSKIEENTLLIRYQIYLRCLNNLLE